MPLGAFAPLPLRLGDDWSPEQHSRLCADVVALKRTSPFAVLTYDTLGAVYTSHGYYSREGVHVASFPSGIYPGAAQNGVGDTTFTWPQSIDDDVEEPEGIILRKASATLHGTTGGKAPVVLSGRTARVRAFDNAGSPVEAKITLVVWT